MAAQRPAVLADMLASVVVVLVALPLCVAVARACGLPPEAGIITGILGGLVVGVLSGSPLQVSGPAAGLIVLVQELLNNPTTAQHFGLIVFLAGGLQLLGGLCRLGHWFRAVSPAVVLGMLAGIGLIILAKQFHPFFDRAAPFEIEDAVLAVPDTLESAATDTGFSGPLAAGTIGLVAVLILLFWKKLPAPFSAVPAAVIAAGAAAGIAAATGWPVQRVVITGLTEAIRPLGWPGWHAVFDPHIWSHAFTLAIIASAETLLCAAAVDAKHTGPRTQYNRELAAQGFGNLLCGALGVLPMTGVIVRSAANLDAGAKTRLSTILHGAWLLVIAVLVPGLIAAVPTTALAAILLVTGWKLLEIPAVRKLWTNRATRGEVLIYAVTAIGIIATDLLVGVLLGVALAAVRLLWKFSRLGIDRDVRPDGSITLRLDGAATFLRVPAIAAVLDALPSGSRIAFDFRDLRSVDHAVMMQLENFATQHAAAGGQVELDRHWLGVLYLGVRPSVAVDAVESSSERPTMQQGPTNSGDPDADPAPNQKA
jgi:MFS superfamily sulfate permease-like transporter